MSDHELRLGDCFDPIAGLASLPDASVDVFIFDPPYSEHVHSRSRQGQVGVEIGTGRATFNRNKDLGFASLDPTDVPRFAAQVARIGRRWSLVFSDTESAHIWRESMEDAGLEYIRTLFWHKVGGTPQFTGDRPATACEAITLCHPPGRKRWNGGGRQGIYSVPIELDRAENGARIHTTQKPLRLMSELVRDFSDEGETVGDPTAGGCTTGVACKRLGRRFIGWERDPKFHADAVKRLDAAREQLQLGGKRVKVKQGALL